MIESGPVLPSVGVFSPGQKHLHSSCCGLYSLADNIPAELDGTLVYVIRPCSMLFPHLTLAMPIAAAATAAKGGHCC